MRQFTVKEASQEIGVTPYTIRAWIRELKEKEPHTYSTHILTHTHRFNKSLVIYTLTEDLVKTWKEKLHTYSHTYFSEPPEQEKGKPENTGQDTTGQAVLTSVIETLRGEIERQGETINSLILSHKEERQRSDTLIAMLRGDVKALNDKLFLLTEGKQDRAEPPEMRDKEKPPEKKPEEIRFTFGDRVYLMKEDIKRILNKKIF